MVIRKMSKETTMEFSRGMCFTLFVAVLVSLLIIVMCVVARVLTIERQVKNQFNMVKSDYRCRCESRGFIPRFKDQDNLPKDIAQMYYYHDSVWRNDRCAIPGEIVSTIHYKENSPDSPPSVLSFTESGILYVICRSTKTRPEMMRDVEMDQVGGIHSGIRNIYNNIQPELIQIIKEKSPMVNQVILFGHSLGAALVDMLVEEISHRYPNIWNKTKAFSSGGPRIFEPTKCDEFSFSKGIDRFIKIINEADMVPSMPSTATTVDGILSSGKKYFYKSFSNKERIYRFNIVRETQMIDSHMSLVYSEALYSSLGTDLPLMPGPAKNV